MLSFYIRGDKVSITSGFIIAGTHSGAGKTTITLGLMSVIKKKGLIVQPFKAGPDYIDPSFHKLICGRPSYNLDTWIMGVKGVKSAFENASKDADISIVEGVMGLFDGCHTEKEGGQRGGDIAEGSTAHLAKVLGLPVVLIIDAGKMAQSAGAVIYGFEIFDRRVKISGVIFNNVGSERHFKILKTAVEERCNAKVLGCIPKDKEISLRERHLGLRMTGSANNKRQAAKLKRLERSVAQFVDVDEIIRITNYELRIRDLKSEIQNLKSEIIKIAVASDNAFCFYYQENLDLLKRLGAELKFFSPLKDKEIPEDINGIYLGGGYPELFAGKLFKNRSMRNQIKNLAQKGLPIYAECGGLMYLGRYIKDLKGRRYNMSGIFPWTARMLEKRKVVGYREIVSQNDCPFLKNGEKVRGHEFHYSEIDEPHDRIKRVYRITQQALQPKVSEEGYLYKNTLASYIHLHFASNPRFVKGFIKKCKGYRDDNTD